MKPCRFTACAGTLCALAITITISGCVSPGGTNPPRRELTAAAMKGRVLHLAAYSHAVEKNYWPLSKDFKSSEEFFVKLMDEGVLEEDFKTFAGHGVPAAETREEFLEGGYNIWCVTADLNTGSAPDLPFVFTKNLAITSLDDPKLYTGTTHSARLAPNGDETPFGNKALIVARADGSVDPISGNNLAVGTKDQPGPFQALFSVLDREKNVAKNVVLRPKNN